MSPKPHAATRWWAVILGILAGSAGPSAAWAQNGPEEPAVELEGASEVVGEPEGVPRLGGELEGVSEVDGEPEIAGMEERGPGANEPGEAGPGALPPAAPGEVGLAPWLPDRLEAILREAIAGGATPGAALVVGRRGRLVVSTGYGRLDWDGASPPVTDSTVYDLASLTKVVATTTAAMLLVEDGTLDLDDPVHAHLSGWPEGGFHGRVTVRHLLEHTSGLPAGARLWRREDGPHDFILTLSELPLRSIPGTVERYGDLDMILLGFVVERAAGVSLDVLTRERIFGPLEMGDTGFQPLFRGTPAGRIAPTEVFRGEHLRGIVHDPNAWAMGGVAGHAGLFSSARDLAGFAAAFLWETPRAVVCRPVLRSFAGDETRLHRFALGWETPFTWSSWGHYFSRDAIGHTGYTGTGIWIDPGQDLFVVLLTNRVNPTSRNRRHLALRRDVHRAVRDAILDYGPRGGWLAREGREEGARFAESAGDADVPGACREGGDPMDRFRKLLPVLRAATLAAAP